MIYTWIMSKMQKTPKGEKIPVPKRGDFMKNLRKNTIAKKPKRPSATYRPKK